jgi:DNA modification methylase
LEASDAEHAMIGNGGRLGLTFRDSKALPVHRWYPYVEGFSAEYLRGHLGSDRSKIASVYDPFGGSGTVNLEASKMGVESCFSEVNPFMRFVAETKVNARFQARRSKAFGKALERYRKFLVSEQLATDAAAMSLQSYRDAFRNRDFFAEDDLRQLLAAKEYAIQAATEVGYVRDLFLLAVASVLVSSSNMTRRADLRRRRDDEYVGRVVDVPRFVLLKLEQIERDVITSPDAFAPTRFLNDDARNFDERCEGLFSLILTSPPYMNGTNYIRNTKLELWFLNFIRSESELPAFNKKSIVCGINNVTKSRQPAHRFDFVEVVARKLDDVSPDERIPALVRGYCSDMADVLLNCRRYLRRDGQMVLDIGDSQFYGVHVPTDMFIEKIALSIGFEVEQNKVLARRHSHDKTPLRQVELMFRPRINTSKIALSPKNAKHNDLVTKSTVAAFERTLPHTLAPYNKRNWGHPFHSLCSYQGKLKPALAHWLVQKFTNKRDLVLDPLGGVGTIAFEAALQGRRSISSDLGSFPAMVASAKLAPPNKDELLAALDSFTKELRVTRVSEADLAEAKFGLNAAVRDYFHPDTLQEVLAARQLLLRKRELSRAEKFLFACLLHILHGNRPYALSRCSHPITPFNPTGRFEYRSLATKLQERCLRIIDESLPTAFEPGLGLNLDFRELARHLEMPVDVIMTSPPFPGMRFDRPNWMRLWFCGWRASDFHVTSRAFLERQQMDDIEVYREFFGSCASLIRPGGALIVHIGGSKSYNILDSLKRIGRDQFSLVGDAAEDVSQLEKHGIRDKGLTSKHHFLFFKLG